MGGGVHSRLSANTVTIATSLSSTFLPPFFDVSVARKEFEERGQQLMEKIQKEFMRRGKEEKEKEGQKQNSFLNLIFGF
jgi:hypothetical protein